MADLPGGKMGEGGGHAGSVYGCSWHPDGTKLLTCGADKTCRLWDVPATEAPSSDASSDMSTSPLPKCVRVAVFTFGAPKPGVEHMQVGCLFVGERMVSLSLSGDLNVLNAQDPATPEAVLMGHPKSISALAVSPDARHVYSASLSALQGGDNVVHRWTPGAGGDLRLGGGKHTNEVLGMTTKGTDGGLVTVGLDDTVRRAPGAGDGGAAAYEAGTPVVVLCTGTTYEAGSPRRRRTFSPAFSGFPTDPAGRHTREASTREPTQPRVPRLGV